MPNLSDEQRATVIRSFLRPEGQVLQGPDADGWYRVVEAAGATPVLGLKQDDFRVTLDEVEAKYNL